MSREAEARHRVANLLHEYVEIADRKDVDAVVEMLGRAEVLFPASGSHDPSSARQLFTELWSGSVPHRHDVSNLIVRPGGDSGSAWHATAHYTRWVLADEGPFVHTLGRYELLVDPQEWSIGKLIVSRVWTAAG
ncbi:hypothetical protein GCM10023081_35960 [Arthrobacter ginkgonis]|uniref:SnoaL-like domain-containing protein n=1 Tax=Arthrobacter ginkgonis TaxID=1630594 RepID=A0ABP7CX70_9MICC